MGSSSIGWQSGWGGAGQHFHWLAGGAGRGSREANVAPIGWKGRRGGASAEAALRALGVGEWRVRGAVAAEVPGREASPCAAPARPCSASSARCSASARCGSRRAAARPPAGWMWLPTGEYGAGGAGPSRAGAERAVLVPQGAGAGHVLPRLRALPGERLPLRRAAAADVRRAGHLGQVRAGPGWGWAVPSAGSHLASLLRSFSLTLIDALDTLLVSRSEPWVPAACSRPLCHLYTWILCNGAKSQLFIDLRTFHLPLHHSWEGWQSAPFLTPSGEKT